MPRDIAIGNDSRITITAGDARLTDGVEAVAQRIQIRLRLFRGEWLRDRTAGVPYFQRILRKPADIDVVRSIYRRRIATTPGVAEIIEISVSIDGVTRTARVDFTARAAIGGTIDGSTEVEL